jgi:hypothetical protein
MKMLKAGIVGVVFAFINRAHAQSCADDIAASVKDGVDVAVNIAKATADCAKADRSACSQDIDGLLDGLDSQEKNIAQATGDCRGESTECVAAVKQIGDAIDGFKPIAEKMVDECAGDHMNKFSCYLDGFRMLSSGATFAAAVKDAEQACKAPSASFSAVDIDKAGTEMLDVVSAALPDMIVNLQASIIPASLRPCLADIAVNAKDSIFVVGDAATAAIACVKGRNSSTCFHDIDVLMNALETQGANIAQGLGDCLGKGPQCVRAAKKIDIDFDEVKSSVEKLSKECFTDRSGKMSCVFEGVHLLDSGVTVVESVMEAVHVCKKEEVVV